VPPRAWRDAVRIFAGHVIQPPDVNHCIQTYTLSSATVKRPGMFIPIKYSHLCEEPGILRPGHILRKP